MAAEETFRRENIDGSAETKWYVAELVLQFRVANEARSILHINTKLINAVSANQAYEKATTLGRSEEADYTNTDGNTVACRFCGLRELFAVMDDLRDGAELFYEERHITNDAELREILTRRDDLAVFAGTLV